MNKTDNFDITPVNCCSKSGAKTRALSWLVVSGALCSLLSPAVAAEDKKIDSAFSSLGSSVVADGLSAAALDLSGTVVGSIIIDNGNVFDPAEPAEDKALYKAANAIHARTRKHVIQEQLLFESGETYSSRLLEESERILRSDPYIQDAKVVPVRNTNGRVDVLVKTRDSWTLRPSVSLSRSGGQNSGGIGLDELNLFGSGIRVGMKYRSDVDRDSLSFQYLDTNVGSSWTQLQAIYASNSDGFNRSLRIEQPFYALDSRFAYGVAIDQNDRIDTLYDRGEALSEYRGRSNMFEAYAGWSKGVNDGWARRLIAGVAVDDHRFETMLDETGVQAPLPGDRRYAFPFIGIDLVQDQFEKARNLEQISRVEDRNLGTTFSARIGFASSGLGSNNDAILVRSMISRGFGKAAASSLMLAASLDTRYEDAGVSNLTLGLSAKFFRRQSEHGVFYAGLSGRFGQNVDLDNLVPLGGDSGLRGYPLRYQMGESSALLTLEQRYFTDWFPFRLFHVGAAVFADIGRSWGSNPVAGPNPGLLRDVGVGLRLGNARAAQGRVVHIDLAYPLDGDGSISNVQFLVETRRSF